MRIKIKLCGGTVPSLNYQTDAGYDLFVPKDTYIEPRSVCFGRQVVPMGFCLELPLGYAASIRPRSGYSSRGIEGMNGPVDRESQRHDADVLLGLCDSGHRGEYGVIIQNHEDNGFWIKKGTRIAQMVIEKVETGNEFIVVDELNDSDRMANGYGSSNK